MISIPHISDMFTAILLTAQQIYPKWSEVLYFVMFCLNTDFRRTFETFDTTVKGFKCPPKIRI